MDSKYNLYDDAITIFSSVPVILLLLSSCEAERIEGNTSIIGTWYSGTGDKILEISDNHVIIKVKRYERDANSQVYYVGSVYETFCYAVEGSMLKLKYIYDAVSSPGNKLTWKDVSSRCWCRFFRYRFENGVLHITYKNTRGLNSEIQYVREAIKKKDFIEGKKLEDYKECLNKLSDRSGNVMDFASTLFRKKE